MQSHSTVVAIASAFIAFPWSRHGQAMAELLDTMRHGCFTFLVTLLRARAFRHHEACSAGGFNPENILFTIAEETRAEPNWLQLTSLLHPLDRRGGDCPPFTELLSVEKFRRFNFFHVNTLRPPLFFADVYAFISTDLGGYAKVSICRAVPIYHTASAYRGRSSIFLAELFNSVTSHQGCGVFLNEPAT